MPWGMIAAQAAPAVMNAAGSGGGGGGGGLFPDWFLGGALGGMAGLLGKKGDPYNPMGQMTTQPERQDHFKPMLDRLTAMGEGQPLMSQGEINRQLSGSYGRADAGAAAEAKRIIGRGLGRQGRMGGMTEAGLQALGRANLGEKRQLEAGVQNELARLRPQYQMQANSLLNQALNAEEERGLREWIIEQNRLIEMSKYDKLSNVLAGILGGIGGIGGGGFGGGPAGGGFGGVGG